MTVIPFALLAGKITDYFVDWQSMVEEVAFPGNSEIRSMTEECSLDVKELMEEEIVKNGEQSSTPNVNQAIPQLDVAFADLILQLVRTST